ncbi:hypothetical protein P4O66_003707, partial [Electrophorus voltai]
VGEDTGKFFDGQKVPHLLEEHLIENPESPQDTVVALQALAKYNTATYSTTDTIAVTVTSPHGLKTQFMVYRNNRLLYQQIQLQEVTGVYNVRASGQGFVFVQFTQHYNIPPPNDFSSFSISFNTTSNCSAPNLTETDMVVIEVKLLSGFSLVEGSLIPVSGSIAENATVKHVDQTERNVVMYLNGLSPFPELKKGETKTYTLVIQQDIVVQNLKPAEDLRLLPAHRDALISLSLHSTHLKPSLTPDPRWPTEILKENKRRDIRKRPRGKRATDKVPEAHSGLQPPLLHRVVADLSGTELQRETPIQRKVTRWTDQLLATLQDALDDTDWNMFQCSNDDVSEFMEAVVGFIGIPRATIKKFPNLKPWVDKTIHEALNSHTATCNTGIISGNMEEYKSVAYRVCRAVREVKRHYGRKLETVPAEWL